ncbi:hypothetical protein [Pacificibacter marinus]|nr:hypothetical protein [Pacificibacter marinus]
MIIIINFALIFIGGLIGARIFKIKTQMRRISYFWSYVLCYIALTALQFGWLLTSYALEAGLLGILGVTLLLIYVAFGAALYYFSAARSNDIDGTTSNAWMAFIPLVNLWLMFKRGESYKVSRPTLSRFVLDPVLLICGIFALSLSSALQIISEDIAEKNASSQRPEFTTALKEKMTLQESLAHEAALSSRELPLRIDNITVFKSIEADGHTVTMTYDIDRENIELRPDFKQMLASEYCAPDMLETDLQRGAILKLIYTAPSGRTIAQYQITQDDC